MANLVDLLQAAPLEIHQAFLGSLISGLFGRNDAKKAAKLAEEAAKVPLVTVNTADVAAMNKAALDNGFNPMTLLNAGGLSAFSTSSTTGHNAMAAAAARGAVPSIGSVIAGAAEQTLNAFTASTFSSFASSLGTGFGSNYFPPAPTGKSDMGMSAALGWGASTRGSATGGFATSGVSYSKSSRLASAPGKPGAPMMPEIGAPKTENPWGMFNIDPTVPGAEAFETRYGDSEIASTLAWGLTAWDDFWYNTTGMTSQERREKFGRPVIAAGTTAAEVITQNVQQRTPKSDFMAVGAALWDWADPWFGPKQ